MDNFFDIILLIILIYGSVKSYSIYKEIKIHKESHIGVKILKYSAIIIFPLIAYLTESKLVNYIIAILASVFFWLINSREGLTENGIMYNYNKSFSNTQFIRYEDLKKVRLKFAENVKLEAIKDNESIVMYFNNKYKDEVFNILKKNKVKF